MSKLQKPMAWVIKINDKYLTDLYAYREIARDRIKRLKSAWPQHTYNAVPLVPRIEPAPRKKKPFEPVMMKCPKAKTCQTRCPVSSKPHMHDENCDRSTIKCPRCVEAS